MIHVYLKQNREKNIIRGNPWIFSGSIRRISSNSTAGEYCRIFTHDGTLIGSGYINEQSAITVRMLTWGEQTFDTLTVSSRIATALERRSTILSAETDSCRLINSEGDFIPGLIVDKFGSGLVVQVLTAGMEMIRKEILSALIEQCSPAFIFERSDTEARKREGLHQAEGCIYGSLPDTVRVRENGLTFTTDISGGQKTGYFFDQRENRKLLRTYARGRRVADCFSYNGPFSVYALTGGAVKVDAIDRSAEALTQLQSNVSENNLQVERVTTHQADVFKYLHSTDKLFDCIILDPPKFARHPGEVERAARGYKDINLVACKLIEKGGILFTFSCSHAIDGKLFRQIVFSAVADSGRRFQLLHTLSAGPDHPVNLAHKEGEYLKGLVLRADG